MFDLELCERGRSSPTDLVTSVSENAQSERTSGAAARRIGSRGIGADSRFGTLLGRAEYRVQAEARPAVVGDRGSLASDGAAVANLLHRFFEGEISLAARISFSTVWTPATVARSDNRFNATRISS